MNTISFSLNRQDFAAFQKLCKSRNASNGRKYWAVTALIVLAALYVALKGSELGWTGLASREGVLALWPVVVGTAIFFGLPFIKSRLGLGRRLDAQTISFVAGDLECQVTANGVETRAPWTSLIDMTATEEHVFLWLSRTSAMIIPLRAFPDTASARSFVELVEQKRSAGAA